MKLFTAKRVRKIFSLYIPLTVFLLFTIFPFYWMLCTSFKAEGSILQKTIEYFPVQFTLDNYAMMFESMGFDHYFLNSLLVSIGTTILIMIMSATGGYALARYQYRGKKMTFLILLITQMLPGVVILVPLFQIFNNLRLINNLWSLTLTYTTINLPFCMITMSGFYASVPERWRRRPKSTAVPCWARFLKSCCQPFCPA